jgi:hypothetical protein
MRLRVRKAEGQDVYRDIVRIPEKCRLDQKGATIPEGEVCKVRIGDRSAFVLLRGKTDCDEQTAWIDERTRNRLGLTAGDSAELSVETVGLWGQGRWAWSSSDPAYRVAARLALLSVVLGLVGLILGIVGVFLSLRPPK